jgi:predicted TIM-barrel fold metal-dependent hydrolase
MRGLKLHLANSGVSLRNSAHATRMEEVFKLANKLRIPIVVHLRSRSGSAYGAEDARLFIDKLLPHARDITVQIAHLAGAGPGHPADADASLAVFAEAIGRGDARTRKLIFDVTTVASSGADRREAALVAKRLRQLGLHRIVFGSDMAIGTNPPLAESWQVFRKMVPLTIAEFNRIATNKAPYLRD